MTKHKKATFTITVEYNPEYADEDSIGNAVDTLLETAMSTPGILDDLGNPEIGPTDGQLQHVLTEPDTDDATYVLRQVYKLMGVPLPGFLSRKNNPGLSSGKTPDQESTGVSRKSNPASSVRSEIHTDGYEYETQFDAEPWFRQASDQQIREIRDIDWRGDYPADDVAWWMRNKDPEVDLVLIAVEDEGLGFEVAIDPADAERWVRHHRPHLVNRAENPGLSRGKTPDQESTGVSRKNNPASTSAVDLVRQLKF
jgi:hypothetical protein